MRAPFGLLLFVSLISAPACSGKNGPSGLENGRLTVTISGLPDGSDALVTVSGPGSFTRTIGATRTLSDLAAGSYTVAAEAVTVGSTTYAPVQASQPVTVSAGDTPAAVNVVYSVAVGRLTVNISGLPSGADAAVVVSGPGGFSETVTASRTFNGLTSGSYTVTASNVESGGDTYAPTPTSEEIQVGRSGAASSSITYAVSDAGPLNLRIDGMYITQSSQTYARGVPLVQGRDGFLRVFVKANRSNSVAPRVRVRFYTGGTLARTETILPPGPTAPTVVNEGTLSSSWNVDVPASLIQSNLTILADVDPDGLIAEASEDDNQFPSSGSPQAFVVRSVPALPIRFVPVIQSNGLTGNVSAANKDNYLAFMRRIYPISSYDADVRAPYTTTAAPLQGNDANGSWSQILEELDALRVAEERSRYHYGVVKTGYSSGIAGVGYIGGRTAMGWDTYQIDEITAHELGHNFGRRHAPCGNPSGVDASYPYAQGRIGVYGYDVSAGAQKPTTFTDIMGYCQNQWVSDYTYTAVLNYLATSAAALMAGDVAQPSLLLWGRMSNGRLILEPAFKVMTRPTLPERPGPYRLEGLDAAGASLFSLSFAGQEVADARGGDERHFAFAVPMSADVEARLATLRLSGAASQVTVSSPSRPLLSGGAAARVAAPSARALPGNRVVLSWNATTHPMALVRDARTGEILSFARGGSTAVWAGGGELDVAFSDGVRSHTERISVSRR